MKLSFLFKALFLVVFTFSFLSYAEEEKLTDEELFAQFTSELHEKEISAPRLIPHLRIKIQGTLATEFTRDNYREEDRYRAQDVGIKIKSDWLPITKGISFAFYSYTNFEKSLNQELARHESNQNTDHKSVDEDLYNYFYNAPQQELVGILGFVSDNDSNEPQGLQIKFGHGEVDFHLVDNYDGILIKRSFIDRHRIADTRFVTIGMGEYPKKAGLGVKFEFTSYNLENNSNFWHDKAGVIRMFAQDASGQEIGGIHLFTTSASASPEFESGRLAPGEVLFGEGRKRSRQIRNTGFWIPLGALDPSLNNWSAHAEYSTIFYKDPTTDTTIYEDGVTLAETVIQVGAQRKNITMPLIGGSITAEARIEDLTGKGKEAFSKEGRLILGFQKVQFIDEAGHIALKWNLEGWDAYKGKPFHKSDQGVAGSFGFEVNF